MAIAAFVNAAKNLRPSQAAFIVAALQQQQFELAEAWEHAGADVGGPADIMTPLLCKDEKSLPEGCYPIVFVDDPDMAGALGYHSVDNGGKYFARVFVEKLLEWGPWNEQVSGCASHEYLELCLNKTCLIGVQGPKRPEGSRYQREASDPVQRDIYYKTITRAKRTEEIGVSNFVLPSYFRESTPKGEPVDYLGTCPGPFQLAPGGYLLVGDGVSKPSPIYASTPPAPDVMKYKQFGYRINGGAKVKP